MANPTPITALIIDAGPLISSTSADSLLSRAKKVYTTPSVIAEIRDAATRSRLETTWLPFIEQRAPRAESVKIVSDFAGKTGDYSVLSVTDLQLLALTYELEVEGNGGDWRLRRVPGQKAVNGPVPKVEKVEGKVREKVEEKAEKKVRRKVRRKAGKKEERAEEKEGEVEKKSGKDGATEVKTTKAETASRETPETKTEPKNETPITEDITSSLQSIHLSEPPPLPPQASEPTFSPLSGPSDPSDSDSGSDWITPANIHLHKARDAAPPTNSRSPSKPAWPMSAALATTDFAMQNVLLQMNLHLVSPSGLHRIRMVKTWILRCHACFKLCRDMQKQFCPSCGGATLLRTSCSTDSSGTFTLHLKRDMQWNNRGNVYPIPKTQHGSASGKGVRRNLILREDQVEYQREMKLKERQKERDLLDPDYLPGILTGERRDVAGRPTIGYGRQNPNRGRGKSKW